ncbi:MAG: hypothetical protein Q9195_000789 [Heterodermia aff. obscurata]
MASSNEDTRPITPTGKASENAPPVTPQKTTEPQENHDPERLSRPRSISRKSSGPLVVSRSEPDVKTHTEYPPDDARGMSPRRSSAECEEMTMEARATIRAKADSLQSGLDAITARIETVRAESEELEKNNLALQEYIGGLTRSMANTNLQSSKKK